VALDLYERFKCVLFIVGSSDRLFNLSRWGLRICEVRHEDPLADYPRGGRGRRRRGLSGPKQQL
jgi:hypothetical protein